MIACRYPDCDRPLRGAVRIYQLVGSCTAGFLAVHLLNAYVLTAGHCGSATWYAQHASTGVRHPIGPTTFAIDNVRGDFQKIRVNSTSLWIQGLSAEIAAWGATEHFPVYGVGTSYPGQFACRFGASTMNSCGLVLLSGTTNVLGNGLTIAGICSAPGDSGAPIMTNYFAYGMVSSTSNLPCPAMTTSYFEATAAQTQLGVRIALAG